MLLKAEGISKRYINGNKHLDVLKGVNVSVKKGEIAAIAGPSGAGKSTLLHILAGLDKPYKGRVDFDNIDLYKISDEERSFIRNSRIGFVFQSYHLLSDFSAEENIMMPAMLNRRRARHVIDIEKKAAFLLEQTGMKRRREHKPSQLSGGEAQRIALARALINDPDIVFCDEPTGNLDSENADLMLNLIKRLNKDMKQTFLIVTHNEKVAAFAGRVLHIEDGQIR